jgi:hypothetical protein
MLTGKKANNGYTVSFSHIRNKKLQEVNLQYKAGLHSFPFPLNLCLLCFFPLNLS